MQYTTLIAAMAFGSAVNAHMSLQFPTPFRASYNPNYAGSSNIDYSITSPLEADGSNFPCKGYHSDLGSSEGKSVVTWNAGGAANFSVQGGATHNGGSCQAALSYDKGSTWTVIHSYIGSCPLSSGQEFDLNIPGDAPTGDSLFAWTWFNEVGNREMYMNCAAVTIDQGSGSAPSTKFADRPSIFVANVANGCTTVEGKDVQFPDPGPDVTTNNKGQDNSGSFTGNCGVSKGGYSGGAPVETPVQKSPVDVPAPIVSPGVFVTATASAPAPTGNGETSTEQPTTEQPTAEQPTVEQPTVEEPTVEQPTTVDAPIKTAPSGSGSEEAEGSPCSSEGAWNCINGTAFQRCASGQWSVAQALSAGTQCTPGQSSNIDMTATVSRRHAGRNFGRHGVRHAHKA